MNDIELKCLVKEYKDTTAVDGIDLEIKKGELFALLGENGAGKTTTIKMLSTLTLPTRGSAFICGYDVVHEREKVKRIIAVSPQENAVAGNLTVYENLELIAGLHGFDKSTIKSKTDEMIAKFDLREVVNKKASKLSGGMQRRLSIAMALICEPKILCLDEPTLGLDVLARHSLWEIIEQLKGKITIVLTTHYMEEAEKLSDRTGVMKKGRLVFVGTAEEMMNKTKCNKFEDAFIELIKN